VIDGKRRLSEPPFLWSAKNIFRRASRGASQFFQTLRRDAAALAGEKAEKLPGWNSCHTRPFGGPQVAGNHKGAEGLALPADFLAARRRDFAHQYFGFRIGR